MLSGRSHLVPPYLQQYFKFAFTIALSALLEAWSNQNDNLVIPLYTWSVASLLG
jgi:dolichol kinase